MEPQKAYWEYMDEFTPNEIYEGLIRGLFPEKIPPVVTMEGFLRYAKQNFNTQLELNKKWCHYVRYETMRNQNRPRLMGIADPFCYERLCRCIKESWNELRNYFYLVTANQDYKVSRLHVRKMAGTNAIFKMNYHAKAWNQDPTADLRIGARYFIRADISSCFPTIYTHSLCWALAGKETAKAKIREDTWYNRLDKCSSWLRDGETTGIMIGNHASNILSEIVLTKIDEELCQNRGIYQYTRNIDDFECYSDTREGAEQFLIDLKDALAAYNLRINYEKTKIVKLPSADEDSWIRRISAVFARLPDGVVAKKQIVALLGDMVDILNDTGNASVVYWAMKALRKRIMGEDARLYYLKYIAHLAVLYPYLYGYFEQCLFTPFDVRVSAIADMSKRMLSHALEARNYEEGAYALYFAIRYGFNIDNFRVEEIIKTDDAVLCLMALLYSRRRGVTGAESSLVQHAKKIASKGEHDFQEQWIFAYEALDITELPDEWKPLKAARVSFVENLDEKIPVLAAEFEAERIDLSVEIVSDIQNNALETIIASFLTEIPDRYDKDVARKYFNRVVANLWKKSLTRKSVCIPKDKSKYYWSDISELGEPEISIGLLKYVLSWLRTNRYMGERIGYKDEGVTRYWAKDKLLKVFAHTDVTTLVSSGKEFKLVVLKDLFKRVVDSPEYDSKCKEYETRLAEINKVYERHEFKCKLNYRESLDSFQPKLKAVFNNLSWNEGGRLYASGSKMGIDYQCINSDLRKWIMIDGKPTVELDYSGLHVNMLYAQKNISLLGDAYDFVSVELRPLAKFAMLVMLNADSEEQVVRVLNARREELRYATGLSPKKALLRSALLAVDDFAEIINLCKAKHHSIAEYFFSKYALKLQNRDSQMALDIVSCFGEWDIPVLPVHDSFIIDASYKDQLERKMKDVYRHYNNGLDCKIKYS